jgi:hypothetical protein
MVGLGRRVRGTHEMKYTPHDFALDAGGCGSIACRAVKILVRSRINPRDGA